MTAPAGRGLGPWQQMKGEHIDPQIIEQPPGSQLESRRWNWVYVLPSGKFISVSQIQHNARERERRAGR